jgi:hypothetical protein
MPIQVCVLAILVFAVSAFIITAGSATIEGAATSLPAVSSTMAEPTNGTTIRLQIGNPVMIVDGREQAIDESGGAVPVIRDSRALLPARAVVEAMGGNIEWCGASQTVTLSCGGDVARLVIGSLMAYRNDTPQPLDVAPVIINNRTMLPIRFIAESFGFDAVWDDENREVTLTGPEFESGGTAAEGASSTAGSAGQRQYSIPASPKVLVAYFSQTGNTEKLAKIIHAQTGGDIFRIETAIPYPSDMASLIERKNMELESGNMPELKANVENMESYDVIFLGYPIWAMTAPPPPPCVRFL